MYASVLVMTHPPMHPVIHLGTHSVIFSLPPSHLSSPTHSPTHPNPPTHPLVSTMEHLRAGTSFRSSTGAYHASVLHANPRVAHRPIPLAGHSGNHIHMPSHILDFHRNPSFQPTHPFNPPFNTRSHSLNLPSHTHSIIL